MNDSSAVSIVIHFCFEIQEFSHGAVYWGADVVTVVAWVAVVEWVHPLAQELSHYAAKKKKKEKKRKKEISCEFIIYNAQFGNLIEFLHGSLAVLWISSPPHKANTNYHSIPFFTLPVTQCFCLCYSFVWKTVFPISLSTKELVSLQSGPQILTAP